jgi:allantoinase
MEELAERGVVGFKAFMCDSGLAEFPRADDLTLFKGMKEAARLDLPVAVHAENQEIVNALRVRFRLKDRHDVAAFLASRPVIAEVEAISRAGALAREAGCRVHIVHVSSWTGLAAALDARDKGADISIETCPHYLTFTAADMERIGAAAKCAPPLRDPGQRDLLRRALLKGEIDIVASDHSPCPPEMKNRDDFFEVWGGIAGVQYTRSVLIGMGLDAAAIARLTSATPAKRFDIARKGAIEIGFDADLALVDFGAGQTVAEDTMLLRHRISPYLGMTLPGVVRQTLRRGEVIFRDGAVMANSKGVPIGPHRSER